MYKSDNNDSKIDIISYETNIKSIVVLLEWILPASRLISRGPREEVKVVFEEGTQGVGNILHSGSVAGPGYL